MSNPVVLVLATQRLTKLVVEDEITKPVRQAIDAWAADLPQNILRERINYAVNCGACSSVWAAAVVLLADRFAVGRLFVRVLAGSGSAMLISAVQEKVDRS